MAQNYQGHYDYRKDVVQNWNNTQGGVYYCGAIASNGNLTVYYVGKAFGDGGIRGRLLQHLNQNKWRDVTHFGYCVCSSENESLSLESAEIRRLNPKYNVQGTY